MSTSITKTTIEHVAQLAHIPVTDAEVAALVSAFDETLATVNNLQEVSVENIDPTHQVTGLTNILRDDEVITSQQFTQDEALANAQESSNGYFVVSRVLDTT